MVVPIRAGSKLVYRRAMADVNILSHTGVKGLYVLTCPTIYTGGSERLAESPHKIRLQARKLAAFTREAT